RAAVAQIHTAVVMELIALGVAAEVVVIVDDQYFAIIAKSGSKEMRRGKAGDSGAHDHQVIQLSGFLRAQVCGELSVARGVGPFKRTVILPAQPGRHGGIVAGWYDGNSSARGTARGLSAAGMRHTGTRGGRYACDEIT